MVLGKVGPGTSVYGRISPRGGGDLASPSSQSWKRGKGASTEHFCFSWTLPATRLPCEARALWEAVVFVLTVLFLVSAAFFPSWGLVQAAWSLAFKDQSTCLPSSLFSPLAILAQLFSPVPPALANSKTFPAVTEALRITYNLKGPNWSQPPNVLFFV